MENIMYICVAITLKIRIFFKIYNFKDNGWFQTEIPLIRLLPFTDWINTCREIMFLLLSKFDEINKLHCTKNGVISSVNVTKSAGNSGFGHIYWRNLSWQTWFFVQCNLLMLT